MVDDFLNDWQAVFKPEFRDVKVISDRWSPQSHGLRDFLSHNQIPYESVKRVASSVGEGSICVQFVHRHLANV